MRTELEAALQKTTETLSQATRLLALVSAPSLTVAAVRHVEVLLLQPRVVIVVLITSSGGITKRVVELEDPSTQGSRVGARVPQRAGRGAAARIEHAPSSLRRPVPVPRERAFLELIRPAFAELMAGSGDAGVRRWRSQPAR